jgi:hypothetical protein
MLGIAEGTSIEVKLKEKLQRVGSAKIMKIIKILLVLFWLLFLCALKKARFGSWFCFHRHG